MSDKPKRRWFQFSLKMLLVTMTMLCVGPGGYVAYEQSKARRQKAAVEAIEKLGGDVYYDQTVLPRSPLFKAILGDESSGNVWNIHLNDTQVTDADLKRVTALKHLYCLSLDDTRVTD